MDQLFIGPIVHCKSLNALETIDDGFLAVRDGKIFGIGQSSRLAAWKIENSFHNCTSVTQLTATQFLMPGMIDCHIHAPQMPNIGLGLDKDLLAWLDAYTFPLEAEYKDEHFAKNVYEKVVRRLLRSGTTTACYFATLYTNSSMILVNEAISQGQRALVGKVSANSCIPSFYTETTEDSVRDNIDFIERVLALKNDRVKPIITPRFALSCDMTLMTELGSLAAKYDLNIQSHISESLGEIEAIKSTYPTATSYADVYDKASLLTDKCVMAHGVHLEDEEIAMFAARGTAVAHCPASNTNLASGLCDVQRLLANGVKVGLGTDVSGGNKPSILDAIRDCLTVSRHIDFIKKQEIKGTGRIIAGQPESSPAATYTPLNFKQAIFLATLGGAQALGMATQVGNFEIGKQFDALLVDIGCDPLDVHVIPQSVRRNAGSPVMQCIEKFVYSGDERNIVSVYVAGREVVNKSG